MGHVDVTIAVGTPDRSRFVEVAANVDTGATFTMLPRPLLQDLGVAPSHRETFHLADGAPTVWDVGEVPVRLDGRVLTTLEQLLLGVDTIDGKLIPIPGY